MIKIKQVILIRVDRINTIQINNFILSFKNVRKDVFENIFIPMSEALFQSSQLSPKPQHTSNHIIWKNRSIPIGLKHLFKIIMQ
ncbi:hypothetical protein MA16_Dca015029 [Dendrobium catenatum]|uniref:Uncharacterized protein n=1 Tax=Dendrobium catenatum TaxID=906689 RepID=A0A2I0VDU9_9ASPA|nr:hypothetical protein MA16_Dca015029 [Dendrobium catenatum]